MSATIAVEVVWATPEQQVVLEVICKTPVTIEQAIRQSGILAQFPEVVLEDEMVGIFGFRHNLDQQLENDDRVEIYRPLHMSPTEARKIRAASRKARQNRA